ncbi:DamX protein [Vibrio xiamenensis]|uniref:DamX protein n=1 Tax=Vibrio xiamenensis TaxID=861298 RepID=A0A1G8BJJ3_9VIBR|nr:AAA family ATPase [Vibrio xiamenensis]SDH33387.1 DamX protein [Vibrio xiamenensis]
MNVTHQPRVLELDTQTDLLERLRLLTNYGSNFVTVGGAYGSGKTWLAQRYLEAWAQDKNQSLLMCHPSQDDESRRSTVLTQLLSEPLFNPHDSLVDSFSRLMKDQSCSIVIVVDDAHLLSETLLSELWMLVLEAQNTPKWDISVVMFAQENTLEPLLTRLSYGQEHKPIDLEVEPLSRDDADRFFEQLVIRFVEDNMEKRVRNAYRKAGRLPGEIMALGEQKPEKRIVIRSIVGSPFMISTIILLLLVVIGGGYWWMMTKQPSAQQKAQQIERQMEQTVIPTLDSSNSPDNNMENVEASLSNSSDDGADDDSAALPPDVTSSTTSVDSQGNGQQRVVITSDVVDALLDGKPEEVDTSAIGQAIDAAKLQAPQVAKSEAEPTLTPIDPAALPEPSAAQEKAPAPVEVATTASTEPESPEPAAEATPQAPQTVITFSYTREALKAFSPRSYTLQLAALSSVEEVQQFLDRHKLKNNIYIYPTVRNDVDWFIVSFGNFPTIQLARDAVTTLPADVQKLEPWAKSLSQVHREIDRVK